MLDITPSNLMAEIQASEEFRAKHLKLTVSLVRRYVGNWWRQDYQTKPVPENLIFSFIAHMLPTLVFDNPQVICTAKRAVTAKPIAQWMQYAINGWIKEVTARDELEKACMDMLFSYGILKVGIEERGDFSAQETNGVWESFTQDALIPYLIRVEPECFLVDSQARSWSTARFMGHMFQRDLADLREDQRYDQEAVAQLGADEQQYQQDFGAGLRPAFRRPQNSPDRNRVTLYEIWLPETRQICCVARNGNGDGMFVRPPTDYIGPKNGPYYPLGVYDVPSQPYPLSPIAAMAEQFMELNAHAVAAAEEAASQKRLLITDSNQVNVAPTIQNARTGSVLAIPGFNPQSALNVDLGGTSAERMQYIELMRQRVDRVSGQSEALRGKAQNVTATEATIASSSADARTEYIHLRFRESVKRALSAVGWFMFHDPMVVLSISWRDDVSGQPQEGLFLGGPHESQPLESWTEYFLDIEPYSMRRVDPAMQAEQARILMETAIQVAPMIVQFPWINWRALLDQMGEAYNIPDFANRVLNEAGMAFIQNGTVPGMLGGLTGMEQGMLPQGVNPDLAAGVQGFPTQMAMPTRGRPGNMANAAAAVNPGAQAVQQMGYFRGAGQPAA